MRKARQRFVLALALVAGALLAQAAAAQAPPPGVFAEIQTAVVPSVNPALEPATLRSRVVRVDMQKITAARRGREALKLNLFQDEILEVQIERVRPTRNGYFITGTPRGKEWGDVRLVVNGPVMVGTVLTPEGKFTIRSAGSGRHIIRQIDPLKDWFECESEAAPGPDAVPSPALPAIAWTDSSLGGGISSPPIQAKDIPTEDGSEVRLLVVYTPSLQTRQGGPAGMRAAIDLLIHSTNQAFEEGGIRTRLVLAHAELVDFDQEGVQNVRETMRLLQGHDDGYFDEVHLLRNKHAADLVSLLIDGRGGLANRPHSESLALEKNQAFFIVGGIRERVFAHELGHNLGLRHDRYVAGPGVYPYAHGYVNKNAFEPGAPSSARWYTIMAYPNRCGTGGFSCTVLFRFANPDQTYLGDPLGVPADSPVTGPDGPADARLTINNMARWVGSFRSEACTEFALSTTKPIASVDGGEVILHVDTAPGCLWRASSQSGFLAIASEMPAAGPGFVAVRVAGNETGADRNGNITIAGQVVSVRQLATRAGVCGRTVAMAEGIAKAVGYTGIDECAEVTDADLASIESLELRNRGIALLAADDFEGLSRLRSLNLESNRLTELPNDLFLGLTHLEDLRLSDNRLTELPADLFASLPNLQVLEIKQNQLTSLSARQFASLTGLRELSLGSNRIAELPESVFEGLSALERLDLDKNKLTVLPVRLFAGLANLEYLSLRTNHLTELAAGVLTDLPGLQHLDIAQNKLAGVPENLGANLRVLILGSNQIKSVSENAFSGLANLESLVLDHNQIVRLPLRVFSGLTSLRSLSLDDNRLTDVPPGLFDGLTQVVSLHLGWNSIRSLQNEVFEGLTSLVNLALHRNRLDTLPEGLFAQLPALERLHLHYNQFRSFAERTFSGATNLKTLDLRTNPGVPIPLQLSFEALQDNQYKAVARAGAPFALNLPVTVSSAGSIDGGIKSVTIPAGATESEPFTVTRIDGSQDAVSVDFGPLPELPAYHFGYTLDRDGTLPRRVLPSLLPADAKLVDLAVTEGLLDPVFAPETTNYTVVVVNAVSRITVTPETSNAKATVVVYDSSDSILADADPAADGHQVNLTVGDNTIRLAVTSEDESETRSYSVIVTRDKELNVCARTPQVRDAIVQVVGADTCSEVTEAQLSRVSDLNLQSSNLQSLRPDDFSRMAGLKKLNLSRNALTTLPDGLLTGLDQLESVYLSDNRISELPENLFSGLANLQDLRLVSNSMSDLPSGIFSGLKSLQYLNLSSNRLRSLPPGLFSDLSDLERLDLTSNLLTRVPPNAFSGLTKLRDLLLYANRLESLTVDIFAELSALGHIDLSDNALQSLQPGTFAGLEKLTRLELDFNQLTDLPADIFAGLTLLHHLHLSHNQFRSLPEDLFSGLSFLETLRLEGNLLGNLPDGLLSGLTGLEELQLQGNAVDPLPLFVSVAKIKDGEFKAVTLAGAPFDLGLSIITSAAGTISDDLRFITIPAGSMESEPVTVMRVEGTTAAVTVDLGELPGLPNDHYGYFFDRDTALPRVILPGPKAPSPEQVTGVGIVAGAEQLDVSWTAVSDADGYKVQWKSGDEDYGEEREASIVGSDSLSYTLTGLTAGAEYTVRVIATRENADDGPPSGEVTGTPLKVAASQVQDVTVTVGIGQLEAAWTALTDADGYKVQWKSGDEDYADTREGVVSGGESTTFTITGLTAGTEYTVRVIATGDDTEDGAPSSEVTGTPKAAAPSRVTGVAISAGEDELTVTWTEVSDADGYKVQWKSGSEDYADARQGLVTAGDTVTYAITGLTTGTEYTVRVIATKANADDGPPSEEITATPSSANPDVNGDGTLDGNDALIMYYSYASEAQVGDGETGGTAESRQSLLAGYSGKTDPTDDELKEMIRKALAWRDAGVQAGGDINEDGEIDEEDAYVMYHAYANANLVGNGTTGGTARFRQLLLASFANKENPTDEDLKAMLRRANKLRDEFG